MATIALVSRKVTKQVLLTAQGLAEQKNEVIIITSYSEKPEPIANVQILSYFKKWSSKEALIFIKKIFLNPPHVFHFFFSEERESASAAHWFLLAFAKAFNRSTVGSLLSNKVKSQDWRLNPFLRFIRAVAVPTRERLMYLKRRKLIQQNKITDVILPIYKNLSSAPTAKNEELVKFLSSIQPFIFVPSPSRLEYLKFLNECLAGSQFQALFLGPRTKNMNQFKRFFSVSSALYPEWSAIVKKSSAILLAHHEYDLNELMLWQSLSQFHQIPLIIIAKQNQTLPGLCLHEKNGFVLESNKWAFKFLLQKNPNLEIKSFLRNSEHLPNIDQSLNDLNRLYVKASNIDSQNSTN